MPIDRHVSMGSMVDSKGGGRRVTAVSRAQRITDRFALRIGEPGYAPWLQLSVSESIELDLFFEISLRDLGYMPAVLLLRC